MDKSLTKLHRSVKNLSPISREHKNKLLLAQTDKKKEEKKSKIKVSPDKSKEEYKYAKNINEYRHIMLDKHTVDAQMAWILDLRAQSSKKENVHWSPKQYNTNEIHSYNKKSENKKERRSLSRETNSNTFSHLIKKRLGGTTNASQFDFETTLRNFRPKLENLKTEPNPEWKGTSSMHKPQLFSSYFPTMSNYETQNKFFTMNNFNSTLKYFEPVYDEVVVGNQNVRRKKLRPSMTQQHFLGEHEGLKKYNSNYDVKNVNEIRHLMATHSNSAVVFEIGLRNYKYPKNKEKTNNFEKNKLNAQTSPGRE